MGGRFQSKNVILLMEESLHWLRLVVYPIIYIFGVFPDFGGEFPDPKSPFKVTLGQLVFSLEDLSSEPWSFTHPDGVCCRD